LHTVVPSVNTGHESLAFAKSVGIAARRKFS